MDAFTKQHLSDWCDAQTLTLSDAIALTDGILAFLYDADDRGYWLDKGWPVVREAAESMGYVPSLASVEG